MKFLVDAQLPRRLTSRLREAGHEAAHTLDLPLGNRTPDSVINELSIREGYVVITKDADFVISFLLHRRPHKLLLVSTREHPQRQVGVFANVELGKHHGWVRPIQLYRDQQGVNRSSFLKWKMRHASWRGTVAG